MWNSAGKLLNMSSSDLAVVLGFDVISIYPYIYHIACAFTGVTSTTSNQFGERISNACCFAGLHAQVSPGGGRVYDDGRRGVLPAVPQVPSVAECVAQKHSRARATRGLPDPAGNETGYSLMLVS